jgi:hypothetical protein
MGVPNDLSDHQKTLKRGEMTFRRDGEVILVSWMDKKIITMISTMHSAEMVEIPTNFGKKRMKPECIEDYSQHTHGVDTADQYLALYPFIRKTCEWLKIVFFYLLQCTLFNSFRLFQKLNPQKKSHI